MKIRKYFCKIQNNNKNTIKNQNRYFIQLCFRRAAEYIHEHEEASEDVANYLANPINAYLLVKRLTSDWKQTVTLLNDDLAQGGSKPLTTAIFSTKTI